MGSIHLALREMRRRIGRFIILALAVSVLVFFLLFQQGLLAGLVTEFVGALRNQNAEVLVYGELARDNIQASVVSPDTVEQVASVDGVERAGPLSVGTFTSDVEKESGTDRTDVQMFGYELGGPGAPATLTEGRLPEGPNEAVTSSSAGDGFEIGDVVQLTGDGPAITIVGLGKDLSFSVLPTLFVDERTYSDSRLAQNPDALAVPPSAVGVRVDGGADPQDVAERINDQVDGVDALTRTQAEERAPGVAELQQSFQIILVLGWVTVGVVIAFFFLILTAQKVPQLTLLRATGVATSRLALAVLVQIALIVVVALTLGTLGASKVLSGGGSGISATLTMADIRTAAGWLTFFSVVALAVSAWRIRGLDPSGAVDGAAL
jgi:putative ABC transport system permease protein